MRRIIVAFTSAACTALVAAQSTSSPSAVSFSSVNDPFGFPTAVVPVTVTSAPATVVASSVASPPSGLLTAPSSVASPSSSSISSTPSSSQPSTPPGPTSDPQLTNTQATNNDADHYRNTVVIPVAVVCTVVPVVLIALIACCLLRRRKKKRAAAAATAPLANEKGFVGTSASSHAAHDSPTIGSPYNEAAASGTALTTAGAASLGRNPNKRDNPVIEQRLDQQTSRFGASDPMNAPSAGASPLQTGYQTAYGSRPPTSQTLAKTLSGNGAADGTGHGGTATGAGIGAGAAAGTAAVAGAAYAGKKSGERSRSRASSYNQRQGGGMMSVFNRSGSRAGRPGTAASQGAKSITSEYPPELPELENDIGSGRLIDGDNPGRDYEKSIRSVSIKGGSIYEGNSIYGRESTDMRPPPVPAVSSPVPPPVPPKNSAQNSPATTGTPRPDSDTTSLPPSLQPQQTHARGTSGSNVPLRDIPVGGSATNTRSARDEDEDDDNDLFGPYKAPKPYNEATMAAERAAASKSDYTPAAAAGPVQSGPYRIFPSAAPAPVSTTNPAGPEASASSTFPRPTRPHGASIASQTSRPVSPVSPISQTFHYPTREEASQFDFGTGVNAGGGRRRSSQFREELVNEDAFFDASEAVPFQRSR